MAGGAPLGPGRLRVVGPAFGVHEWRRAIESHAGGPFGSVGIAPAGFEVAAAYLKGGELSAGIVKLVGDVGRDGCGEGVSF